MPPASVAHVGVVAGVVLGHQRAEPGVVVLGDGLPRLALRAASGSAVGHLGEAAEDEVELDRHRLLAPQRAVVVEHRDALLDGHGRRPVAAARRSTNSTIACSSGRRANSTVLAQPWRVTRPLVPSVGGNSATTSSGRAAIAQSGPGPAGAHRPKWVMREMVYRRRGVGGDAAIVTRITAIDVVDVRFPTSRTLDGSDAMNPDPDYSAAYLVLRVDDADVEGYWLLVHDRAGQRRRAARRSARSRRTWSAATSTTLDRRHRRARPRADVGQPAAVAGPGEGRHAHGDRCGRQRRVGPARAGAPGSRCGGCWRRSTPEEIVAQVDFRTSVTPSRRTRRSRCCEAAEGRAARIARLEAEGYPAYTTSAGWLGYDDDKVARLAARGGGRRVHQIKFKVGADLEPTTCGACGIARAVVGDGVPVSLDANQRWGVDEAIELDGCAGARSTRTGSRSRRRPTTCSAIATIRRRVRPIRVATGEHVQNRVMFKQLLQAEASTSCRSTPAASAGSTRTSPSSCSPRSSAFRCARTPAGSACARWCSTSPCSTSWRSSATSEDRWIEYVDHLHEHFTDPVVVA